MEVLIYVWMLKIAVLMALNDIDEICIENPTIIIIVITQALNDKLH